MVNLRHSPFRNIRLGMGETTVRFLSVCRDHASRRVMREAKTIDESTKTHRQIRHDLFFLAVWYRAHSKRTADQGNTVTLSLLQRSELIQIR